MTLLSVVGCTRQEQSTDAIECPPFEAMPLDRLTVAGAREAHRRLQLRRHLRFKEAESPGYTIRTTANVVEQDAISRGRVCFGDLYETGRILFEHEYSFADGLAGGDASNNSKSPFRRVHRGAFGGPETNTCTSCHWRGGPAGAGSLQDNSFIRGDGDWVASGDTRNPPPLHGVGVIQVLAQEMSDELAAIRSSAIERAVLDGRSVAVPLLAKGVEFGVLRVSADGAIDTSGVEGVDPDLVIRPFGWKGNFATIREFVAESLHVHMNIQSDELIAMHRERRNNSLVGRGRNVEDPDQDGLIHELTHGHLTAIVVYLAALELPVIKVQEPLHDMEPAAENLRSPSVIQFSERWARGRYLFEEIGCATCHTPMMVLKNPIFETQTHDGRTYRFDLSQLAEQPRLEYDERLGGYPVWLYSDLKRHDMGTKNASRYVDRGVAKEEYQTRRLWGLANSGPYFYDGRAPSLDLAIEAHEGEAVEIPDAFNSLSFEDKGALRVFLMSLRRERQAVIP